MPLYIPVIITVIIIIPFLISLKDKKTNLFTKMAALVQALGVVWMMWYAIKTNKENNDSYNIQLTNQTTQIEKQQELINRTDTSTKLTLDELKSISGSSSMLIPKIETINQLIGDIPFKVDKISGSFDLLNQFTQKEVEMKKEESDRKSDLTIKNISVIKYSDSLFALSNLNIMNKGNLEGKFVKLFIYFDSNEVNTIYSESSGPYCSYSGYQITLDFSKIDYNISAFDSQDIPYCNEIKLVLKYNELRSLWIKYTIIFSDDMGRFNDGVFEIKLK